MRRVGKTKNPFQVELAYREPSPVLEGYERFYFDVNTSYAIQRYEIDAVDLELALDALERSMAQMVKSASHPWGTPAVTPSTFRASDSSRSTNGTIALIVVATIGVQWVLGAVIGFFQRLNKDDEDAG